MPFRPTDPMAAMALLTRLPIPGADHGRGAGAAWAWPLAGLAVGGLGWAALAGAMALGLPVAAAAGLALGVQILTTGGLHEDGLADTFDGLWGGRTPDRRLEIMRDSRLGTYGALALVIVTGLRWSGIAALAAAGAGAALVGAAMLSRSAMSGLSARLPLARRDGLAATTGRARPAAVIAASAIGVLGALAACGPAAALAAAAAVTASALWISQRAHRGVGGQTGDVLGACQQLAEAAALLAFATLLG